jgi:hypothetical protein
MEIVFAFGSFLAVLGACALAARERPATKLVTGKRLGSSGEPGFLRRLAS